MMVMMDKIMSLTISMLIGAAAKLEVADAIGSDGAKPLSEIARTVGCDADRLRRIMRYLVSKGAIDASRRCFRCTSYVTP